MVVDAELIEKDITAYLDQHERKELLRFVTIGSVDDGKSTLIGRLLFDTGSVYQDIIDSVKKVDEQGNEVVDLANITDGLLAEREQGITIDVAYRYFTTPRRKFIIADTPGHIQYTRNMATGASTAQVAIILIDARYGVLQQTRRHAYISHLLGIPHLMVAVNKMDLMEHKQNTYESIRKDMLAFTGQLSFDTVTCVPVSALNGDNVVHRSEPMGWYEGQTVLEYLEAVPIQLRGLDLQFCMPVQYVLRPDLNFRGFSGTIACGAVKPGDEVISLPSGMKSKVKTINTYDGDLQEAFAPQSVTLTLEDEIDASRGDMLAAVDTDLQVTRHVEADIVWMSEEPMDRTRQYLIKHTSRTVGAFFSEVDYRLDLDTLEKAPVEALELNDIGRATLALNRPIIADRYLKNRDAGAFIIIDRLSNATVGAGMIAAFPQSSNGDDLQTWSRGIPADDRARRFGQIPSILWITGRHGVGKMLIAHSLERRLYDAGHLPWVLDPYRLPNAKIPAVGKDLDPILHQIDILLDMGLIAISACTTPTLADRHRAKAHVQKKLVSQAYLEVHLHADEDVCAARLEADGREGRLAHVPYEEPEEADIVIDANKLDAATIERAVDDIMAMLAEKGVI